MGTPVLVDPVVDPVQGTGGHDVRPLRVWWFLAVPGVEGGAEQDLGSRALRDSSLLYGIGACHLDRSLLDGQPRLLVKKRLFSQEEYHLWLSMQSLLDYIASS